MRRGTVTVKRASRFIAWLDCSFPDNPQSVVGILENIEKTHYFSADALLMIERKLEELRRQVTASRIIQDVPKRFVSTPTD
ncbi:MAG: hypothetical protein UV58_C0011G0016 [Candidatus Wolfebacteria bacterium GW2011_GWC1_43_10]|uniref:Uncharacterized protein n=2 Tax=Candidatus Wolfeibacteriota TaxID=1752735 RepID=A0A0G1C9N6_9BACT|nr:MAG: hypothetical protein UV58_C0011G0016 [Candidatus Wolfebacteria bacterium GW2011_GWC1_43_10]KKT22577.1 MAG: hypothetical protein UW08_C0006G0017 [Parcubacteria group bacterium GW2011_GWB1_43_8b]OGM89863.1 MAG: hypothetical protein A2108_01010 [Candidatus Wolfebacteria bacterium GWA1_42_9]